MLENNPIVIAGGGHAGIEAALAAARLKIPSIIVTMEKRAIGRLSCNPAIGGLGKSHLVKEIDALGGIMGMAADYASIQYKTLNKTKGRAVWSLRSQVDKKKYPLLYHHVNPISFPIDNIPHQRQSDLFLIQKTSQILSSTMV